MLICSLDGKSGLCVCEGHGSCCVQCLCATEIQSFLCSLALGIFFFFLNPCLWQRGGVLRLPRHVRLPRPRRSAAAASSSPFPLPSPLPPPPPPPPSPPSTGARGPSGRTPPLPQAPPHLGRTPGQLSGPGLPGTGGLFCYWEWGWERERDRGGGGGLSGAGPVLPSRRSRQPPRLPPAYRWRTSRPLLQVRSPCRECKPFLAHSVSSTLLTLSPLVLPVALTLSLSPPFTLLSLLSSPLAPSHRDPAPPALQPHPGAPGVPSGPRMLPGPAPPPPPLHRRVYRQPEGALLELVLGDVAASCLVRPPSPLAKLSLLPFFKRASEGCVKEEYSA